MKAIKYAYILERISLLTIPLSILGLIAQWGSDALIRFFNLAPEHGCATLIKNIEILFWQHTQVADLISGMPCLDKILGFCVDGISLSLFVAGLWQFILFTRLIQKGELFSMSVINHLTSMSKFALLWAIYQPIARAMLTVITSWHKGSGHRILTIDFGSNDIFNILLFCFFVLIAAIVQEAYGLKKEQDLTI